MTTPNNTAHLKARIKTLRDQLRDAQARLVDILDELENAESELDVLEAALDEDVNEEANKNVA
jgi:predicted  nucleic acid-binding Zn-ribbon protein